MKPQSLTMDSEIMAGAKANMDTALQDAIAEMMELDLNEGTVTLKVNILIEKKIAEDGEIIRKPKIASKVSAKYGSKFDLKTDAAPGLVLYKNRDGEILIVSNQISIDDLETA